MNSPYDPTRYPDTRQMHPDVAAQQQPKPGTPEYLQKLLQDRQHVINLSREQMETAAARINEIQTPAGYEKWVAQKQAEEIKATTGKDYPNGIPMGPLDIQTAYKNEITNQRLLESGAAKALNDNQKAVDAINNAQNPAVVARLEAAANSSTTNARMLYQAQAEREQNAAAGFGAVTNQQKLQNDVSKATQQLNLLHTQVDLTQAMSDDQFRREFSAPRQLLVDSINAANKQLEAEQTRQAASLKNDESVWNTLYNGAMTEYANDYTNKVSQRNQDLQTATSLAGDAARIVGNIIPHAASNEVMNDVFGPNSTYAKMGGTPQDWTNRPTNAPSIQDMINQPLTTFNAAYAGMPGQVQMPGFTSPGSAPMAADYLHQTPSEQYISGLYGQQLPTPQVPQGSPYSGVQQQMQQTQAQMAQQPYLPPAPIPQSLNYQPQMTPEQAAYAAMYGGNVPNVGEE